MARRPLPVRTADGWKYPVIGERRPHLKRRLAAPRLPTGRGPPLIDSCLRAPLETIAAQLSTAVAVCRPNARCPTAVRRTPGVLTAIAQFRAAPARALHHRRTNPTRGSSSTEAHLRQRQPQRRHESPGPRRPPAHHGARHLRAAKRLLEANHPLEVKAAERGHRVVRANPTAAGPCVEAGDKKKSGTDPSRSFYGHLRNPLRPPRRHHGAVRRRRNPRHRDRCDLRVRRRPASISALDDYTPSTISRVYGSHGEIVGEFSTQRREIVPYGAISPKLKQAILAAEDSEFEQHFGLSMPHIVMAATRDILGAIRDKITGRRSRPKGASTITQQLARGLFPEAVGFQIGDVSLERKIKEALVAVQIEKRYTKSEIFTLYANQMYLGRGRVRRGGRIADLLRQVGKGSHAGRSGDHRGPLPDVA